MPVRAEFDRDAIETKLRASINVQRAESSAIASNALRVPFQYDCGYVSHVGLQRRQNQDSYCSNVNLGLWLVADGMGGHALGEFASAIARESIIGEIIDGRDLVHAVATANREICRLGALQNCSRSMGSTVVALHICGADFELVWVGDSRCYLAMGSELRQLSSDHSFMQELIDAGVISPRQAKTNRYRNVVTQALGITAPEALQIDSVRGTVRPGMRFLLCSDGLTEELSDAEIAQILHGSLAAQAAAEQLIAAALEKGGADNVTAVVLRID